jgi:hypothetical protein
MLIYIMKIDARMRVRARVRTLARERGRCIADVKAPHRATDDALQPLPLLIVSKMISL